MTPDTLLHPRAGRPASRVPKGTSLAAFTYSLLDNPRGNQLTAPSFPQSSPDRRPCRIAAASPSAAGTFAGGVLDRKHSQGLK